MRLNSWPLSPLQKFLALSFYVNYIAIQTIHWRQCTSKAISVRPPDGLTARLSEIAKETERPKSFHIQKALEAYWAELADLQVAIDRLHDTSDPVVRLDEMRKELEL